MADIYDILAATQEGSTRYLQESPLFNSAISMAKYQAPAPENNTQAIFGPLLQGLLSGSMAHFGRESAYDKGYTDARANPLLRALEGYQSETRPEGWDPDMAKSDVIQAALLAQQAQEKAIETQKAQAELTKALATQGIALTPEGTMAAVPGFAEAKARVEQATQEAAERGKVGSNNVLPGIPSARQPEAIQEMGIIQKLESSKKAVDEVFGQVKEVKEKKNFGGLGRLGEKLTPYQTDHERKIAAAHTTLVAMAQTILGAEPNAAMQERIAALSPSRGDTPAAVEEKAKLAKQFLESLRKPTPTLDLYGMGQSQGSNQEVTVGPDGQQYVFVD